MRYGAFGLLALCVIALSGCGPSGPPATAYQQPIVTTTPPLGATAAPTSNPTASMPSMSATPTIPAVSMPDISTMHCTSSTGANAGSLTCN